MSSEITSTVILEILFKFDNTFFFDFESQSIITLVQSSNQIELA